MIHKLEFKDIHKTFVSVRALKGVSFSTKAGEVCAVVGENGRQKHAAEDLSGDLQPDKGCLLIDGEEKNFKICTGSHCKRHQCNLPGTSGFALSIGGREYIYGRASH